MPTSLLAVVSAILVIAGTSITYLLGGTAYFDVQAAQSWTESPCRILNSAVVETRGGTEVELEFEYEFGGRTHRSDHYQFLRFFTNDHALHKHIVRRLPAGTKTTCYVDPTTPENAVLDREFPERGRWLLLPLGLACAGLVTLGVLIVLRVRSR